MKQRTTLFAAVFAMVAFATVGLAEIAAPAAPQTGQTTIGQGQGTGPQDGTGAKMRNGQKQGSGKGDQIRKRDGSCPGGNTPTQTRQGKGGGKGRGRSGGGQ